MPRASHKELFEAGTFIRSEECFAQMVIDCCAAVLWRKQVAHKSIEGMVKRKAANEFVVWNEDESVRRESHSQGRGDDGLPLDVSVKEEWTLTLGWPPLTRVPMPAGNAGMHEALGVAAESTALPTPTVFSAVLNCVARALNLATARLCPAVEMQLVPDSSKLPQPLPVVPLVDLLNETPKDDSTSTSFEPAPKMRCLASTETQLSFGPCMTTMLPSALTILYCTLGGLSDGQISSACFSNH
eukprot:6200168-Pleurochrysis_carterae.AAC.3